jgi:hypothetical protein
MFEISTASGVKGIEIERFKALDGWEIQNKFISFAASSDKDFRRAFTLEVLSYATVIAPDGRLIPLSTSALIDNHLETWDNVKEVFEAVLKDNGIDPETHASRPDYWSDIGAQLAVSFLAQCATMIGPAMENADRIRSESNGGE